MNEIPYIVSWNVTQRCNLRCPHCYIDACSEANNELSAEEAKFVIDELSYLNRRLMLVLSGGEPMLRKDIFSIVEYAAEAGIIVVMGSNGTLLTEENLRDLSKAGLRGIGISIDSTLAEKHDVFRGTKGAWDLSIDAIMKANYAGLETQMDVTLTDQNWEEIDSFVNLGKDLGVKAVNFFFLICTGRALKTDITTENYERALERITELMSSERDVLVRPRCAPHFYRLLYEKGFPLQTGTRGCLAGISYLRIDPQGNVTPCPYMPVVAGNLRENSLKKIWEESDLFKKLRKASYQGRCGICEYTEICGGCRARAFVEKKDVLDEDPLCAYMPDGTKKIELKDQGDYELQWTEEARERIKRVPLFMRKMVIRLIEQSARQNGTKVITTEFIDTIKKNFMRCS